MLLIRRAVPAGGLVWTFPSGKVEAGESVEDAATRETLEEAGVVVEPLRCWVSGCTLPPAGGWPTWCANGCRAKLGSYRHGRLRRWLGCRLLSFSGGSRECSGRCGITWSGHGRYRGPHHGYDGLPRTWNDTESSVESRERRASLGA
ncbi:NUDIX domain-containing protein [Streptomyces sp. NPDC005566]|uniref:NUDIX hydrolase n=1 Tax=Streptomyces sp. NPDC005566 TaxID=3156886 RepID=UPI0033A52796